MKNKIGRLLILLIFLILANNSVAQNWDYFATGLFCKKCNSKVTSFESEEIGSIDLNIEEGFHRFVIEIHIYAMNSDWVMSRVLFYGHISKQKYKNCFVLEDEANGIKILLKRNWKNNWVIKDGPGIIKGLELNVLSHIIYRSVKYEKYFRGENPEIKLDSSSSNIEISQDNVFTNRDGLSLYLKSNGHFLLTMGNGNNECYTNCFIIAKGVFEQKGNELDFFDRVKLNPFKGYVINCDTIICNHMPGGTSTFSRKK